jgi:hypothetical protein
MEVRPTLAAPSAADSITSGDDVMKSSTIALALALGTVCAGTSFAVEFDQARFQKCSVVRMDWDKANKSGAPGRRKALKAVLESAKADPVITECFSEKIQKDLGIAAMGSSVQQGWAAVIKTNTYNFTAAKDQAPADQCSASKLMITGWNAFYAERKDISAVLDESAQNKHKALCGG